MSLIENLRNDPSNQDLFTCNASVISYKTGIPILDYYLGYKVKVSDKKTDEIITVYDALGIASGSINTFVGETSCGKTTTAVGIAGNIVRNFKNGFVIHWDIEQALNYTRISNLTKFKPSELENKYILRQENTSLEDIKLTISHLYKEKMANKKQYLYNTGMQNEFGEPIIIPEPTVIIIDSIAALANRIDISTKDGSKRADEIGGQTEAMRFAAELGRFYKELLPCLRAANIIILAINQLRSSPSMGIPKASEVFGLSAEKQIPGGKASKFYSNTLIYFQAVGKNKYNKTDDGFTGFGNKLTILKARTNCALKDFELVYDSEKGMDSIRSSVEYARNLGLVGGNKNGYYFLDHKDAKFTKENMLEDFRNNRELFKYMYEAITPSLKGLLSDVAEEDKYICDEIMDY